MHFLLQNVYKRLLTFISTMIYICTVSVQWLLCVSKTFAIDLFLDYFALCSLARVSLYLCSSVYNSIHNRGVDLLSTLGAQSVDLWDGSPISVQGQQWLDDVCDWLETSVLILSGPCLNDRDLHLNKYLGRSGPPSWLTPLSIQLIDVWIFGILQYI